MKNNQPVTQTELFLDPAKPIVTKTDLKGVITYANESFVSISGFQREELIGASHNIVRHPDMPPAAFADLWQTIKAGHPWRGFVKNRSKGGDFYWVEAYVTPITEDGKITGYMSVRTPPSRQDVAAAEALYRQVNAGNASLPATHVSPPLSAFNKYLWGTSVISALLAVLGSVLGGAAGVACGIGAALAAVGLAFLARARLVAPLGDLEAAIRSIDEGQLNRRIPVVGAIAPLLERLEALRIHQRAIFADVLVSSNEVDAKVRSLDEAMQVLMTAAEQQMDQVQKVAAAMEQMSVSISEISSSTQACLDAAVRTEDTAHSGMTSIGESIENSRQVAVVVDGSKRKIGEVNAAVARISDISRVIKDIATQTNLLALNAAIEAARAGEHGRGFAIVADEVRKLAESTESSTSEIATIVGGVVAESEAAVATMAEVATEVNRGVKQIEGNGTALKAIWETSQQSARFNRDITDMLKQQTATSQEIAINMERISTTLESSNASVASVGQAARRLRATSEELRRLVSHMESALS